MGASPGPQAWVPRGRRVPPHGRARRPACTRPPPPEGHVLKAISRVPDSRLRARHGSPPPASQPAALGTRRGGHGGPRSSTHGSHPSGRCQPALSYRILTSPIEHPAEQHPTALPRATRPRATRLAAVSHLKHPDGPRGGRGTAARDERACHGGHLRQKTDHTGAGDRMRRISRSRRASGRACGGSRIGWSDGGDEVDAIRPSTRDPPHARPDASCLRQVTLRAPRPLRAPVPRTSLTPSAWRATRRPPSRPARSAPPGRSPRPRPPAPRPPPG